MLRSPLKMFAAWLCLTCYALTSTILAGPLVFCEHSDGTAELEWGPCNWGDGCVGQCGDEAGCSDAGSQPCKDTPVKSRDDAPKASARSDIRPAPIAHALPPITWVLPRTIRPFNRAGHSSGKPPDPLARLRTVIILV